MISYALYSNSMLSMFPDFLLYYCLLLAKMNVLRNHLKSFGLMQRTTLLLAVLQLSYLHSPYPTPCNRVSPCPLIIQIMCVPPEVCTWHCSRNNAAMGVVMVNDWSKCAFNATKAGKTHSRCLWCFYITLIQMISHYTDLSWLNFSMWHSLKTQKVCHKPKHILLRSRNYNHLCCICKMLKTVEEREIWVKLPNRLTKPLLVFFNEK